LRPTEPSGRAGGACSRLQPACNELDDLPITRAAADEAVRKYANALLREAPDAAWD
jgi:hypothetical protein